jgi:hypothetical protein
LFKVQTWLKIKQPKALLHNLPGLQVLLPLELAFYNMMSMQNALKRPDGWIAYSLTAPATSSFCSCSFAASETSQTHDSFPILHHFKYYGIGSGSPFSLNYLFIYLLKNKILFFSLWQ